MQNGTLKTYEGFPHGMPTTHADTNNADLLAFLQSDAAQDEMPAQAVTTG